MSDTMHGFPFWLVEFDDRGNPRDAGALNALTHEITTAALTDLYVFSHGWNNSPDDARHLYDGFFGEMAKILADPTKKARDAVVGFAGVIWPAILWPDGDAGSGGAVSVSAPSLAPELKKVFVTPSQHAIVDELTRLLDERSPSDDALRRFKVQLRALTADAADAADAHGIDSLEGAVAMIPDDRYAELFDVLAGDSDDASAAVDQGGAAGFSNPFARLWDGAKNALRVTTYWQMKNRAAIVGLTGLAPLLGRLHAALPALGIHLIGHSFGARLVSYSLSGLPATATAAASPVKSLFLVQGAFSHFAFADKLPFDAARHGDLAGMAARVDGPLMATHTLKDGAVGTAYPLASMIAGQDASDASDQTFRWGAMGHDGAQAVNAASSVLGPPGTKYTLAKGAWINLDGNHVIVNGGPPAGAHSDIVHPETAWAALAGAGLV
jgi:hypothetical protein